METPVRGLADWNPMLEDYNDPNFNTYNSGPGKNLPSNQPRQANRSPSTKQEFELFVNGIPNELSEEGLANYFSRCGHVLKARKKPSKVANSNVTYGFVSFGSLREAQQAIEKLDRKSINNFPLRVNFSKSKEDQERARADRLRDAAFSERLHCTSASRDSGSDQHFSDDQSSIGSRGSGHASGGDSKKFPGGTGRGIIALTNPSPPVKAVGRAQAILNLVEPMKTVGVPGGGSRHSSGYNSPGVSPANSHSSVAERRDSVGYASDRSGEGNAALKGRDYQRIGGGGDAPSRVKPPTQNHDSERANPNKQETPRAKKKLDRPCLKCGTLGSFRCAKCKGPYCSPRCQTEDWKSHREICKDRADTKTNIPAKQEIVCPEELDEDQFEVTVSDAMGAEIVRSLASFDEGIQMRKKCKRVKADSLKKETLTPGTTTQKTDAKDILLKLQDYIEEQYADSANIGPGSYVPEEGEICVALFREDNCWYRARCDRIGLNAKLLVTFVDYGNKEEVSVMRVMPILEHTLLRLPLQAIHCRLDVEPSEGQRTWSESTMDMFNILMTPFMFCATCKGMDGDRAVVELTRNSDKLNIVDYMLGKTDVQRTASGMQEIPLVKDPDIGHPSHPTVAKNLDIGSRAEFLGTQIDSPSQFWVRVLTDHTRAELGSLHEKMREHYDKMPRKKAFRPTGHNLYAVRSPKDNQWYRCQVYSITPSLISIMYLDFGHRDKVELSALHPLESKFCSLPFQALRCSVAGVAAPTKDHWHPDATKFFRDWILDGKESLQATILEKFDNWSVSVEIRRTDCAESINESLVQRGYGKKVKMPVIPQPRAAMPPRRAPSPRVAPPPSSASKDACPKTPSPAKPPFLKLSDVPSLVLPTTEQVRIRITDSQTSGQVFVQLLEEHHTTLITELDGKLQHTYSSYQGAYLPQRGEIVAVLYMGSWARAETLDVAGEEVEVRFIDYGNIHTCISSQVANLAPTFAKYPIQGLECSLAGIQGPSSPESLQQALKQKEDTQLLMQIMDLTTIPPAVTLFDPSTEENINTSLIAQGVAVGAGVGARQNVHQNAPLSPPPRQTRPSPTSSASYMVQTSSLPETTAAAQAAMASLSCKKVPVPLAKDLPKTKIPKEIFQVFISTASSPDSIFAQVIHYEEQRDQITELCKKFAERYANKPGGHRPSVLGEIVAAKYSVDNCYYRSEILAIGEDSCQVHFVDYGNKEVVAVSDIKELDKDLLQYPVQAVECSLHGIRGVKEGQQWEESYLAQTVMLMETVDATATPQSVNLYIGENENVGVKLVENGVLEKVQKILRYADMEQPVVAPGEYFVRTTDIPDGSGEFVVQIIDEDRKSHLAVVEKTIAGLLQGYASRYKPQTGELVCAKFSADQQWYRAVVLELPSPEEARVRFVDYGNQEVIGHENIGAFDQQLLASPILAVWCRFQGSRLVQGAQWNSGVIPTFQYWTMVVHGCDENAVCAVELYDTEGNSMKESLIAAGILAPVEEPVRTASVEAPALLRPPSPGPPETSQGAAVEPPRPPPAHSPRPAESQPTTLRESPRPGQTQSQEPVLKICMARDLPLQDLSFNVNNKLMVAPCFVESANTFYAQDMDQACLERVGEMTAELRTIYSGSRVRDAYKPQVGELVAAYCELDEAWYRAEVLQLKDANKKIECLYVEYGNQDLVEAKFIRSLDQACQQVPKQARKCVLRPALKVVDKDKGQQMLKKLVEWKHCLLEVEELKDEVYFCSDLILVEGNLSLVNVMTGEGIIPWELEPCAGNPPNQPEAAAAAVAVSDSARPSAAAAAAAASAAPASWESISLDPPSDGTVCITHVNSVSEFFVQEDKPNLVNSFSIMMKAIKEEAEATDTQHTPSLSEAVAAKFSGAWYRGGVVGILEDGNYSVFYLDFGNTSPTPPGDIRQLAPGHLSLPRFAKPCSLKGVCNSETASQWLARLCEVKLDCLVVKSGEGCETSVVELSSEGQKLHEVMVAEGVAQPAVDDVATSPAPQSPLRFQRYYLRDLKMQRPPGEFDAAVIEVTSPSHFYCHMVSSQEALQKIMEDVRAHWSQNKPDPSYLPQVGEVCCCQFSADSQWYRAVVLGRDGDNVFSVQYVDFANSESRQSQYLIPISSLLMETPVLAVQCSLTVASPLGDRWPQPTTDAFKQLVSGKILTLRLDGTVGDSNRVQVLDEAADIGAELVHQGLAVIPGSGATSSPEVQAQEPPEPAAEPLSRTISLEKENRRLREQMAVLQEQVALILKQQKNS